MKKILVFAFAAILAATFGSCVAEKPHHPEGTTDLIVKLSSTRVTAPASRAIDTPATGNAGDLDVIESQSLIFVADASDNIIQSVVTTTDAIDGAGQDLGPVPVGSSIYVVANIPSGDMAAVRGKQTLAEVKAAYSAISTQQATWKTPAMANVDGVEADVTSTSGAQTVTIRIEPLFARLEVVAMQAVADAAGNTVTDFKVTGVYVGEFFENFDYTGAVPPGGSVVSYKTSLEAAATPAELADIFNGWTAYMKNEGSWASASRIASLPDTGAGDKQVWAYNLVASGTPEIIFRIEDISYTNAGGTVVDIPGPRYLTVDGYQGVPAGFERGEVYRIGTVTAGDSNFRFDFSNLNENPYEESVGLTVDVEIVPWNINDYTPVLRP